MAATAEYELVLLLDPELAEDGREKIVADSRARIEGAGELKHSETWGQRKLAFEIGKRAEADYRFFRFTSEPPLLDDLDHNLKITDGVLRFRLFKVDPDSPVMTPPIMTLPPPDSRDRERGPRRSYGDRGGYGDRDSASGSESRGDSE